MDPNATQGLSLVMQQQVTPLRNLQKDFYLISQLFISIGILALLLRKDGMNFKKEFKSLSLAAFIILMAGVFLPFFSSQMNTSRLYHMSLIILAPFCIIGIIKIFHVFKSLLRFDFVSKLNFSRNHLFTLISIFLIVFLFFDTGFTYQVLDKADVTSIALSATCDFPKFDQREVTGGQWLQKYSINNVTIYADKNRASVLNSMIPSTEIPTYFDLVNRTSYIFLGTVNIVRNKVLISQMAGANIVVDEGYRSPDELLKERFRIYDDGGSYIYGSMV
jgi:Predicted membrane protein